MWDGSASRRMSDSKSDLLVLRLPRHVSAQAWWTWAGQELLECRAHGSYDGGVAVAWVEVCVVGPCEDGALQAEQEGLKRFGGAGVAGAAGEDRISHDLSLIHI